MLVTKSADWYPVYVNVFSLAVGVVVLRADSGSLRLPRMRRTRGLHEEMIRAHRRTHHIIDHVSPKSTIVDELQGLVHFTSPLGIWQMQRKYRKLLKVESKFWLESEG